MKINTPLTRSIVAVMTLASSFLSLSLLDQSHKVDVFADAHFQLENLSTVLIFVFIFLTVILINMHNSKYYPFLPRYKKIKLDQKTTKNRNQIFELSYLMIVVWFVIIGLYVNNDNSRDTFTTVINLIFSYLALPSVIASFRRKI